MKQIIGEEQGVSTSEGKVQQSQLTSRQLKGGGNFHSQRSIKKSVFKQLLIS